MEQFPTVNFVVKNVFVSNTFALGATNRLALEWENTLVNREGRESHNTGVMVVTLEGRKAVAIREYIFDLDCLKADYGEA